MDISCNIAEDLLPLYVDGSCSEDSRAALEEHLQGCPSCRAALERMRSGVIDGIRAEQAAPELARYARKVQNHRIRMAVSAVFAVLIASAVLALLYLTFEDMRRQSSPYVPEVEAGTCNLTADSLETMAEDIEQYVFFTNSTQIQVTVQGAGGAEGTILLWNAADSSGFIRSARANGNGESCTFTALSATQRYQITCEGLDGAAITVSDGRTVNFWNSLCSVLGDIAGSLGG